jgi:hypothetical protein
MFFPLVQDILDFGVQPGGGLLAVLRSTGVGLLGIQKNRCALARIGGCNIY